MTKDIALIMRMSPTAILPTRGTPRSIGLDCYADMPGLIANAGDAPLLPGQHRVISLGFAVTPPEGTYGRLAPRSGLASKSGIQILGGVIDEDYTGELRAIVLNTGHDTFWLRHGMKICQLIFEQARISLTKEVIALSKTQRGADGFGSTGQ